MAENPITYTLFIHTNTKYTTIMKKRKINWPLIAAGLVVIVVVELMGIIFLLIG